MKIKILNLALLLVSLFGTLLALSFLPEEIPVHFDFYGVADRWGSKYEMLIMPIVMLFMLGTWFVTEQANMKDLNSDNEKKVAEARANNKVIAFTFTAISILFLFLNAFFLYLSYSQLEGVTLPQVDIMRIIAVATGVLFIILGNVMPKAKSNSTVGFRMPWTRFNDVTWYKCNRFGGIAMMVSGLITAIGGLIFGGVVSSIIMMFSVFGSLIVILIYAYLIYQDEKKKADE